MKNIITGGGAWEPFLHPRHPPDVHLAEVLLRRSLRDQPVDLCGTQHNRTAGANAGNKSRTARRGMEELDRQKNQNEEETARERRDKLQITQK